VPPAGESASFDTGVAHVARIYDYWLGGIDNCPVDRAAGDAALQAYPDLVFSARANRAFLARAVRYLATEAGIRQFLDIGPGLPTSNNTHEVVQAVAPDCRVVYVDNDPVVLAHARALLTGSLEGATGYLEADLRDPGLILDRAARTLDLRQPVAIVLMAVLHLVSDTDDPYGIVATLTGAVAAGSYLVLSHVASDIDQQAVAQARERISAFLPIPQTYRSRGEVTRFFAGLHLVEPGIVRVQEWRPDSAAEAAAPSAIWGGVGRTRP
jgi:hypothetical protein